MPSRAPYLTVVDPAGLTVVRRERLRTSGSAIKVDTRRGWISIGSPGSTTVEFYEPSTLLPLDAMTVEGGVPGGLCREADGLYAVNDVRTHGCLLRYIAVTVTQQPALSRRPGHGTPRPRP